MNDKQVYTLKLLIKMLKSIKGNNIPHFPKTLLLHWLTNRKTFVGKCRLKISKLVPTHTPILCNVVQGI